MSEDRKQTDQRSPDGSEPHGAGGDDPKGSPSPPPPVKLSRGLMSWVMILALLIMLFVLLSGTKSRGMEIDSWREFKALVALPSKKTSHRTGFSAAARVRYKQR